MNKRPNGAGTIEVLDDGRARVRVPVDGKRKQLGIYPDETTALEMLTAWNRARDAGEIIAPTSTTLATYGSDCLNVREVSGSRARAEVQTIDGERSIWSRHVAPSELGRMALGSIRTRDVEAFATWLRGRRAVHAITRGPRTAPTVKIRETERPLSRSMQTHALRLVRMVLDEAVRAELLTRNPADGVRVAHGGPRARDLSDDWLRADEIAKLGACETIPIRDRRAFLAAIGLALRLNDLKSIEVAHVRLDADIPGPHVSVWISKSQRWHAVPVMPWLIPVVREQLASLPSGARYLFPTPDGGRYAKYYDFGWAQKVDKSRKAPRTPGALERAGIARRIRFHDLRGTTATHLASGTWGRTWSLHEIQQMLAHSDQRVTERYVRRAGDALSAAAAATTGDGCPALPLTGTDASAASARDDESAPGGIRTCDLSLRNATATNERPEKTRADREPGATRGNGAPVLGDLARAAILSPTAATMQALAEAVLDVDHVRLALEVRAGGEHADRAALRLAALVLAGVDVASLATAREG